VKKKKYEEPRNCQLYVSGLTPQQLANLKSKKEEKL
jgi:hypothetical protein